MENTGLTTLLARKERLLAESLTRSSSTEATLLALQTSNHLLITSHKIRLDELEEATAQAEERKIRVEAEYEALRGGMQSMSEGWKADLEWLKGDIAKLEARNRKDVEDVKGKQTTSS